MLPGPLEEAKVGSGGPTWDLTTKTLVVGKVTETLEASRSVTQRVWGAKE